MPGAMARMEEAMIVETFMMAVDLLQLSKYGLMSLKRMSLTGGKESAAR